MAEAAAQMDSVQRFVRFSDVLVYFSEEEWELLDEAQKSLYCSVILDNFGLVISVKLESSRYSEITQPMPERELRVPDKEDTALAEAEMIRSSPKTGCWHRVEDEDASSEQGVSVGVSQVRTLEVGPSIQKSHPCEMCDPILKYILSLAGHQGTSPGQPSYPCKSCGTAFWFSVNLDQIQKQQSGEIFPRMENVQPSSVKSSESQMSEKVFTFREGGEDFLASSGLAQHHTTYDRKKPYGSAECEEAFHTGQRDYKCSICGEAFSHKDEFVQHQKIHMGETFYECSECRKLFSHRTYLILHKKAHLKTTPYKCSDCGKKFCHKVNLKVHQRCHTVSRPYKCAECGKSFIKRYQLVQHQRIHSGVKPYRCTECGKVFTRKDTCTQHWKIHSGERPHVCSICGKAFLRKTACGKHEKIHTGEKPYNCDECGKFFGRSSCLSRHKKIHSRTEPYACNECEKTFNTNFNLTRHKKVHTRALGLVGKVNVENCLVATSASLYTRDVTPEQGLMCSANVGEPTEDPLTLLGP
ncbi:zinc finger protein 772-like [Diceros bicornis minor]|uniref:zinc finger protein 772-like n=1 Tax=Diceros bicornis minor TaxID=77932 RepID=UPI0026EED515|nr:zinc finger protein 772-like [Diceros bicornis minor]